MNHLKAKSLLLQALTEARRKGYNPRYSRAKAIQSIICGYHLTFRYILVTGVLGKAADGNIHPRSLQAGANLPGSYDARSLCHDVFVPFEREHLEDALGGSNEPYLNKPARFPSIELSNAVRAGTDRIMLESLYTLLEELNSESSNGAFDALCDCMYFALIRLNARAAQLPTSKTGLSGIHLIQDFVEHYTSISVEGETCATAVGALLTCLEPYLAKSLRPVVHPSNQAGSSSNEIADIDVMDGRSLAYAIEVKDKAFSMEDVQHALKKVMQAGHGSLVFVVGPQGRSKEGTFQEIERRISTPSASVIFVQMEYFSRSILALAPNTSPKDFYDALVAHCNAARVKDKTREHLAACARKAGWIS